MFTAANQVPVYDSTQLGRAPTLSAFVESIKKTGSAALTGAVTLTGGTNVTLTQSGNDISIAASGGGAAKLYDYTVTGSDKASIDTNVDGTTVANFAGYDILEVYAVLRTDDALGTADVDWTVNNTGGTSYDRQYQLGIGTVNAAGESLGTAAWATTAHGSGGTASYPSVYNFTFPGYADTTFNKVGYLTLAMGDSGAGVNHYVQHLTCGFRSTAAISRIKVAAQSTAKLKVGSRLIVYGR